MRSRAWPRGGGAIPTAPGACAWRCLPPAALIRAEAELLEQAVAIAASEQITVYDAAYVAAARREAHLLVSTDVKDLVQPGLAVAPDAKLE